MRVRLALPILVTFAFVVAAAPAFPQASTSQAQLNGSVLDQSGRAIVQATVTLRNLGTDQLRTVSSNAQGYYIFTNITPGSYDLAAVFTGFGKYSRTGIPLTVGQAATIDVTLKPAEATEQVTVSTEAPPHRSRPE